MAKRTTKPMTARHAFCQNIKRARELHESIGKALFETYLGQAEELTKGPGEDKIHWGHVGDVRHVMYELEGIAKFLEGRNY